MSEKVEVDQPSLSLWQKFWMSVGIIVTAVVLFGYFRQLAFRASTLTVVGEGKVTVAPEQASFIVTKVNLSNDVPQAIDAGESQVQQLINLVQLNTAGDIPEIRKIFYQVNPLAGGQYSVVNAISVKTQNVDKVYSLIKLLYQNGATTVANVTFTTLDQNTTSQQARDLAVADAKVKAKQIAKSAGKRLGRLVSIADDNTSPASSVANTIGEIEITKRVSVVFEVW